jgi:1-acyl-sn-glycerol-3-phosphate acyltransferase
VDRSQVGSLAMGPLLPDDGPRGARLQRRVKGIGIEGGAFAVLTLAMPLVLALAATVDLALWLVRRKPWMAVRLVAFAWWFLQGELRGVTALGFAWLRSLGRDTAARRRRVYHVRHRWAARHIDGVRVLFGLTFEVEGLEVAGPGPVTVLIRHASIIDNMLPDTIVGRAHDLGLRFVIKRELQMIPTIDIGGRMIPTNFVRRGSGDTAGELVALRKLAIDLEDHEGLLIYPEGTRYTAEKLAKAQATIAERQPEVAPLADQLRHVLPPRLGGPLALLEAARGVDVVVFGHVGLDGFEYISDIWAGGLVGTTVRMKFWRYSAAEVPEDRDELTRWLYGVWQTLDDWVGEQRAELGAPRAAKA